MKGSKHMLTIVVVLALISFMSLSFSASYSYVIKSKLLGNVASIATGNLNFSSSYVNVTSANVQFLSDADGMNQSSYSVITINKAASNYSTFYYLLFAYTSANTNYLPFEDLKVAIYSIDSNNNLSAEPLIPPFIVGDCPIFTGKTYNAAYYIGYYGVLDSTNTQVKFAVKVWGDENSADKYDEKPVNIGARTYQYPLISKTVYTLQGTVYDSSSNPLPNATISLQNGLSTVISDSSGDFTLTDVYNGNSWNLDVFYQGEKYSTQIKVTPGSKTSIVETASSTTTANVDIVGVAAAKYTTPYKIINYPGNQSSDPSVIISSNLGSNISLTVPKTYTINGLSNTGVNVINNVRITLNDSDHTISLQRVT